MTNTNSTITVNIKNVESFRKIYESKDAPGALYGASVSLLDLYKAKEQIGQTLGINPRNQKDSSLPSRAMEETLNDAPDMFVFRNRGITFLAKEVSWDNNSHDLKLTFILTGSSEGEVNGLADGAHTYQVLMRYIDQIEETERKEVKAHVRLDILTGFEDRPDEASMIVEARNTSTQVGEESLLDSRGYFEPLKKSIKGTSYENLIAYHENQLTDEKDAKSGYRPIKVSTILSYLMCFDPESFDENSHPVRAYSSKKKAIEWYVSRYEADEKDLSKFLELAKEVLSFHDYVESQVPKVWNKISGRYADQKGAKSRTEDEGLPFGGYKVSYIVPGGHVYPVMSAFRSLIEKNDGDYEFKILPAKLFDQMNNDSKRSLINKLVSTTDKDPQTMGKNHDLYDLCYGSVRGFYYEHIA